MPTPDDSPLSRAKRHLLATGPGGLPSPTDLRAAVAACTEALRRDPDDAEALVNRGTAQFLLGQGTAGKARLAEAEEDFDRAVALAPGNPAAWGGRAAVRFDRYKARNEPAGRHVERLRAIVADWTECLRLMPGVPQNLAARALALHDLGLALPEERLAHFRRAFEDADRSLAALPDNGDALVLRGTLRLALEPPQAVTLEAAEASIADYERALPGNPKRPFLMSRLASARAEAAAMRIMDGVEAWPELARAVRELDGETARGPVNDAALKWISDIVEELGRRRPGNPQLVPIRSALAFARARAAEAAGRDPRPDLEEALRLSEETVRMCPQHAGARFNFGQALAGLGRLREACAEMEEALRLDPKLEGAGEVLRMIREKMRGGGV